MNIFKVLSSQNRLSSLLRKSLRSTSQFHGSFQGKLFDYLSRFQNITPHSQVQQTHTPERDKNFGINASTPLSEIFQVLDYEMRKRPGFITSTVTYKNVIKNMPQILHEQKVNKNDLIKLIFYLGLQKKTLFPRSIIYNLLLRIQDCLDSLTLEDSCIVANTIFKMGVSNIDDSIVNHIKAELRTNFQQVIEDPAVLLCLTKLLRISKSSDYELLKKLSITSDKWAKNFTIKAHILALFAESKYYNKNFVYLTIKSSLEQLQDTASASLQESERSYLEKRVRAKDVARFLWASSALGCSLQAEEVEEVILPQLHARLRLGKEYIKQPSLLIDSLMSLGVMGHYSKELMEWIFSSHVSQHLKDQNKIQPWTKLELLLTAAQIECPEKVSNLTYNGPQLPQPTVRSNIEQRKSLGRVYDAVQCLAPSYNLTPHCDFQVAPLHIAGIVLCPRHGPRQEVHVEVLDPSVCLYDSNFLTGLMKLKLRLQKSKGINLILVEQTQLTQDDDSLFMWLEDVLQNYFK